MSADREPSTADLARLDETLLWITTSDCPKWCVRHTGDVDIDEEWVWHHGRPIEWQTFRDTKMSLALTAVTDRAGVIDKDGIYLELAGEPQDGFTVGAEFGLEDVNVLIDALRELVDATRRPL